MKKITQLAAIALLLIISSCSEKQTDEALIKCAELESPVTNSAKPPNTGGGSNKPKMVYLNFNGKTVSHPDWRNQYASWNGGTGAEPFVCQPSGLDAASINEIIYRTNVDYAPYNIEFTTDIKKYERSRDDKIEVVITVTSWWPDVSGASYVGAFTWYTGTNPESFVFNNLLDAPHKVSKIVSHEVGHAVGLHHQSSYNSDCIRTATYTQGAIMGVCFNQEYGAWITGNTWACNVIQDDNAVLLDYLKSK